MSTTQSRLAMPLAVCTIVAWAASLAYGMLKGDFTALEATTPVVLVLAGYVFGVGVVRTAMGSKGGDS